MKLILLGYMGSGKSSVAKELAEVLNYRYTDLDTEIEKEEGMSVSSIFSSKGEIYFRKKEAAVLKSLMESPESMVIASGGGTPCYGNTMELMLKNELVTTMYLKGTLDTLTDRLFGERASRPLIAHLETREDLKDFIRKHLFERGFYYNQAKYTVEIDGLDLAAIVRKIVAYLF